MTGRERPAVVPITAVTRKLILVGTRLSWAAALLVVPDRVIRAGGGTVDTRSRRVARILGARHALQGVVELVSWPRWRRSGIVVDGLHAATAAGLAAFDPDRRRVALTDTGMATSFALLGAKEAPH